jgi:hypothetical protein
LEGKRYLIYKSPVVKNVHGKKYENLHSPRRQRDSWSVECRKKALETRYIFPSMKKAREVEKDYKPHLQNSESGA